MRAKKMEDIVRDRDVFVIEKCVLQSENDKHIFKNL
jgi:hypothetical protein